jgi:Fe-S-cluster containining protein
VTVTDGDLLRIEEWTGRDDFWERRHPLDPDDAVLDQDDPAWHRGTVAPDGTRQVLRRRPGGACTFLGEHGCTLPENVRPIVCRLYPFAYSARGLLAGESAHYCPSILLARAGRSMSGVLGMDRTTAEAWRAQLYEELAQARHSDALGTHV